MKKTAIMLCLVMLLPLMAFAQEADQPGVSEQGIQLGSFIFTPSFELIYESKDNIFLRPSKDKDPLGIGEESDSIYVARARFMLEYPFADNYFRATWVPQWRDYADNELQENFTHYLDLVGSFNTPSGLELDIANHYVMGSLEVQEVDPGQELVYGDVPFTKNTTTFDMKYFFTPTDGFGLYADYTMFEYDDPTALWYDYTSYTAGLSYQRYMNPLLRMALGFDFMSYDADQNEFSLVPDKIRDYDGYNVYVKFYGDFSPTVNSSIKIGYESLSFDKVAGYGNRDYDDFSVDADLTWEVTEGHSLTFDSQRKLYASNFADVSSFTHSHLGVRYNAQMGAKTFGALGMRLLNNDYNESSEIYGRTRSDDMLEFKAELGYHINPTFSTRLNYTMQDRDSNINMFDYKVNIWAINLVIGF
ncbi:MAG TPA: outer membrane beta-barrel protein [Thermoanaerobaculia bacterium]|nr:outer membrane beta-barrel protein [Thermoanaerobaculia bacterium]HUM29290.1 outer membrane beta-barrel protein [Thermoanaerobaculia bacterium]HXK67752.1 outer membrane beta-barrel protein [Thermoanaerobaculia bacterium]